MASRTIAYLTPLYFDEASCLGGGERYPLNLARGVVAAPGTEVRIELISFGARALSRPLGERIDLRVLPLANRPIHPLDVASWDLPDALAGADLVHIHQAYTRCAELGILAARLLGKPLCITDHGGFSSPLGTDLAILDLVDQVVAYSDFGASFYRTQAPIAVVKGGVDAALFQPPEVRPARDRFLYVGRLLPHKGIDQLIATLPPDLPLTVCGRPYHPDYFALLQRLASGKRVEFVLDAGDDDLRGLYARSWATVLPSVYRDCYGNVHEVPELMGFTLLEAMACGTPGVANNVGAMPEFIDEGETGFVYREPAELTRTLVRLAGDPDLVERMGEAARRAVVERFDLTVAGAKLRAIYDNLWRRSAGEAAA